MGGESVGAGGKTMNLRTHCRWRKCGGQTGWGEVIWASVSTRRGINHETWENSIDHKTRENSIHHETREDSPFSPVGEKVTEGRMRGRGSLSACHVPPTKAALRCPSNSLPHGGERTRMRYCDSCRDHCAAVESGGQTGRGQFASHSIFRFSTG